MLINSNYTVGQYFLASSIINSSFKKKKTKGLWYIVSLIISSVAFNSNSH